VRQASWNELFTPRPVEPAAEPRQRERLLSWEDVITFAIVLILFLSVLGSIDSARWVDDMPSLYPLALAGLLVGLLLARSRAGELLAHSLSLLVGAAVSLVALLFVVSGGSPAARVDNLVDRMHAWFGAAFGGDISTDTLAFVVLLVVVTWLAAYASAWSIFRWHNAWLGLVPGGLALLTNISYLPGQFSIAFVFFLFGAVLLVMRVHLLNSMRRWRESRVPYPEFLSLSSLHLTFWAALLLLGVAWAMPPAPASGALRGAWERLTGPVAERASDLSRVFAGVHSKKPVNVHRFESTLPFQGRVSLGESAVMQVQSEEGGFLRAQVYEVYTPMGWKTGERSREPRPKLPAEVTTAEVLSRGDQRRPATVEVTVDAVKNAVLTLGEPVVADVPSQIEVGQSPTDVIALRPADDLKRGQSYKAVGSVSAASVQQLREDGTAYPASVADSYLQLPDDLPPSVAGLARYLTRYAENPYDMARAIEDYLRTYLNDFDIPLTPAGRDTVDYFLFDLRRGYFDYHASAMVVMLRSIGIPSRLAVGYVLGEADRDPESKTYLVTEKDAFAWPQAYFPGLGWIDFNPTPTQPLVRRPGEELGAADNALGPSGPPGESNIPFGLGGAGVQPPAPAEEASREAANHAGWVIMGVLLGLLALVLTGAGAARWGWQWGLADLDRAGQVWAKTVRLASWARLAPCPQQTPREFARDLNRELGGVEGLDLLAESYGRSRFGKQPPSEPETARLEAVWRVLRRRLAGRLLRRRPGRS
jgi:transglutaminase-like putative cysteine protease